MTKRSHFLTPKQGIRRIALDRLTTAIHEAGHTVIARHVGILGRDVIRPNKDWSLGDSDYKSWYGNFRPDRLSITPSKRRIISIAGLVAELAWRGSTVEEDPWAIEALIYPDCMSESDWQGTGCEPGDWDRKLESAFVKALGLLQRGGPLWPKLIRTARSLISDSRTNGDGVGIHLELADGSRVAA
jgi:hypothetical protein